MAETQGFAQRSSDKLYFEHRDLDFNLQWIVGRAAVDGSDRQECLELARQISENDPASWRQAWPALAERVEAEARRALDDGDTETARSGLLRACTYHRAPLFVAGPDDAGFRDSYRRSQACFRQAAALFDPPIEAVEVHYSGKPLAGYFWQGEPSTQPRPTVVVVGGIETFAEDCYLITGQRGPRRGYNMLAVDLPGQGLNPDQGLTMQVKSERSIGAVLDYALSRPEVDPERVALFGFSWGGYLVLRAARHDRRIKALIANPATPDIFGLSLSQQSGHDRNDPISRAAFSQIAWRMGLRISPNPRDIARRFGAAYNYMVHGRGNCQGITCPVLCMAGEGEAAAAVQQSSDCFAVLSDPRSRLAILTKDEGGEAHCQINNLPLLNQTIFDWLDTVFVRH